MSKELTINLDDELYTDLMDLVGEQNTDQFIESVLRSHLKKEFAEETPTIYDVELPLNDGKMKIYVRSPHLTNPSDIEKFKLEMTEEI